MGANLIEILFGVLALVIPWLFPDWGMGRKIVCSFIIFLLAVIYWLGSRLLRTSKQADELKSALNDKTGQLTDVKERHSALAEQFRTKSKSLRRYKEAIRQIQALLNIAMLTGEQDKIAKIYESVQYITHVLINEED